MTKPTDPSDAQAGASVQAMPERPVPTAAPQTAQSGASFQAESNYFTQTANPQAVRNGMPVEPEMHANAMPASAPAQVEAPLPVQMNPNAQPYNPNGAYGAAGYAQQGAPAGRQQAYYQAGYAAQPGYEQSHASTQQGYGQAYSSTQQGYDQPYAATQQAYEQPYAAAQTGYGPSYSTDALYPMSDQDRTLRLIAFIFNIISTVSAAVLLIPLAWMIPMTVMSWGIYKGKRPNTTAFGVCNLIFLSLVGGILLLCSSKQQPYQA